VEFKKITLKNQLRDVEKIILRFMINENRCFPVSSFVILAHLRFKHNMIYKYKGLWEILNGLRGAGLIIKTRQRYWNFNDNKEIIGQYEL